MGELELRILGCGDAFGSGSRLQTCFHLRGPEGNLLIDCGATALVGMKRYDVEPNEVGWVVLSHLHGDHFGGLPFLVLGGQFGGRTRPLVIAGPPGVQERVEALMEACFPGSARKERRFRVEFVELDEPGKPAAVGPASVTPFAVVHPSGSPAYALRVEYAGKVVAFSGDTEWTDALLDAARGADLLLCECYFREKKARCHLDYQTLREKRPLLDCKRLLLTHLSADLLERIAELEFEVASDGQVISL